VNDGDSIGIEENSATGIQILTCNTKPNLPLIEMGSSGMGCTLFFHGVL
jgi:hypothetical protein